MDPSSTLFEIGMIVELGGTISIRSADGTIYKAWLKKSHRSVHNDMTNSLALGDEVEYILQDQLAVIFTILPPKTILIRQSTHQTRKNQAIASNLDQAMVIIAKNYPLTPIGMIDRMLIATKSGGIKPLIIINKMDESENHHEEIPSIYGPLGIPIHEVSAKTKQGIDHVKNVLKAQKTVFLGISGVGKTSLVKALTGIDLKVSHLNESSKSGRHTTTHSKLYELDDDTFVADIPGIKQLGFLSLDSVVSFYPEIQEKAQFCKYSSCTHTHEPECKVLECLQNNLINPKRFASYQKLIKEQIPHWEW